MKAMYDRSRIPIQLSIVLILALLVTSLIWKVFLTQKTHLAEDYQFLASISPDEVIFYQKNKPNLWKDYISVRTISQNSQISVELQNQLIAQLDRNIRLKDLDWLTADEKSIEAAQNCYKLLGQYTIYTPGAYGFPLKQTCYYIDTFGADRDGGKRSHEGTDLFDQKGTPILSVTPGKIEKLGWNRLGGERVGVRGDDGNYYYYAHLDKISEDLYLHKRVNKGEFIGTMGNTGDAITTPDHLHFGIELPNGEWVNPYPFLKVWEFYSLNGK